MKSKLFLVAAAFGLLLFAVPPLLAQDSGDLLGRINNLRASQGLPGYTSNGALSGAAQSQAQWMIDNGCAIAHTHPDGSTPRTRSSAYGYPSTDVSENIYCGTMASSNDAWVFWINSAIHYRGLINARYQEIGIASARGAAGASFVLVFGNPSGQAYVPPAAAGGAGAAQAAPSYVLGLDEYGNIMHEIQPEETLGDIALIYGYTWGDIPNMLTLNGLTQDDIRLLQPGAVFLVPSKMGTFTPTPGGDLPTATYTPFVEPTLANTSTPIPSSDANLPVTQVPTYVIAATSNSVPQEVALLLATATANESPVATALDIVNAGIGGSSEIVPKSSGVVTRSSASPWLGIALVVQAGVLVAAGVEFVRRKRKR